VLYAEGGERIEYEVPPGIPPSSDGKLPIEEIPLFVRVALGEEPNPVTRKDGHRALEIVKAINRSARTKAVVHLPLELE